MISNKNQILHCKCAGIGYYRAVVIKNKEVSTETVLKEIDPGHELSTVTTLTTTTSDVTTATTPKAVADENKTPKLVFFEKPLRNTSNEELKLMGTTTTSGI